MKHFNVIKNGADRQDPLQIKSKGEGVNNYSFQLGNSKTAPWTL
jgi:hypothetical protein